MIVPCRARSVALILATGLVSCTSSRRAADEPTEVSSFIDGGPRHVAATPLLADADLPGDGAPAADADQRPEGGTDEANGRVSTSPWTEALVLAHASHPVERAPTAVVHGPEGFDPNAPLELVVLFHGWNGCAQVLVGAGPQRCRPADSGERPRAGWGLGARHDEAGTNTLLVVPQLAWLSRDGEAGRFGEPGFFRAFLEELIAALSPRLGPSAGLERLSRVVLVAHSAGFETTLAVLDRGGLEEVVDTVVLLDALYAAPALFARWVFADSGRRLVTLHTGRGLTARFSAMVGRAALAELGADEVAVEPSGALAEAVANHRVVVDRSPAGHGAVPARHLAVVLGALGLRSR